MVGCVSLDPIAEQPCRALCYGPHQSVQDVRLGLLGLRLCPQKILYKLDFDFKWIYTRHAHCGERSWSIREGFDVDFETRLSYCKGVTGSRIGEIDEEHRRDLLNISRDVENSKEPTGGGGGVSVLRLTILTR
ncbi:hypothetical protein V6N13_070160 [Hibiscus sabdariffa]